MSERKALAKLRPQPQDTRDSREALIEAGKRVFAQKGYAAATVKDLSDAAGVNASLISYHFGGKEGLYRTCLTSFGSLHVESVERLLGEVRSKEDFRLRLKLFAEEIMVINNRDQDLCKIIFRGMETLDTITADVFKKVFFRIFEAMQHFMHSAQKMQIIRADLDTEITTALMFGSLMHFLRAQDIAKVLGRRTLDDAEYRSLVIEHWMECFINGVSKPPKT